MACASADGAGDPGDDELVKSESFVGVASLELVEAYVVGFSIESMALDEVGRELGETSGEPIEPSALETGRTGGVCCPAVAADLAGLAETNDAFLAAAPEIVLLVWVGADPVPDGEVGEAVGPFPFFSVSLGVLDFDFCVGASSMGESK